MGMNGVPVTPVRSEGNAVAKRGDLVLVESQASWQREPEFELERVVGVTREGRVRDTLTRLGDSDHRGEPMFRDVTRWGRKHRQRRLGLRQVYVISAARVDAVALWAAWCERQNVEPSPSHPDGRRWNPEPFRTLEEAAAFIEPFRRSGAGL
ncbi:MAG TPA: hypothetical protein VOB72_08110 [Candidatus Dormibacteraeota bacterium]|nr:hypothetical protein [Candidatus Dormibacteraeota bacterium]